MVKLSASIHVVAATLDQKVAEHLCVAAYRDESLVVDAAEMVNTCFTT